MMSPVQTSERMRPNLEMRRAMSLVVAIAGALCATVSSAEDTRPEKKKKMNAPHSIAILAQLKGDAYLAEREEFLHDQKGTHLGAQATSTDAPWRVRMQAKIVQGWLEDRSFFKELLSQLDSVNPEQERKTAIGISRIWDMYALKTQREYHERILPLAWEAITKFHESWPAWKIVTFLYMISARPTEESIDPVLCLMEETRDPLLRSAAGQTLAKLPRSSVEKRLTEIDSKYRTLLQATQETRDRFE
jgi:hypothetical protein